MICPYCLSPNTVDICGDKWACEDCGEGWKIMDDEGEL